MSNPILEGMARASYEKATSRNSKQMPADYFLEAADYRAAWEEEMRAALLYLADNVSDEMCKAAARQYFDALGDEEIPARILVEFGGVISASLRQAAGGGE